MSRYDENGQTTTLSGSLLDCKELTLLTKDEIERNHVPLNLLRKISGMPILVSLAYSHHRNKNKGQALGSNEVIGYLINQGLDINLKTCHQDQHKDPQIKWEVGIDGETVLHAVARTGYVEAFSVLLRHGARLDIEDANGQTPMQCVDAGLLTDFSTALDQHYLQQIGRLHNAAKRGDDKGLKKILDGEIRLSDDKGITALIEAAKGNTEGHLRCVQYLCAKAYADSINDTYLTQQAPGTDKTALHHAAEHSPQNYEELLKYDEMKAIQSQKDAKSQTPQALYRESQQKNQFSARRLLSWLAGISQQESHIKTNESSPLIKQTSRPHIKVK